MVALSLCVFGAGFGVWGTIIRVFVFMFGEGMGVRHNVWKEETKASKSCGTSGDFEWSPALQFDLVELVRITFGVSLDMGSVDP